MCHNCIYSGLIQSVLVRTNRNHGLSTLSLSLDHGFLSTLRSIKCLFVPPRGVLGLEGQGLHIFSDIFNSVL